MKIFISWSKPETKKFALFLSEWLQLVIQSVKPWMSERDVAKGTRSMSELGKELEGTQFGIIVLTAANQDSPWINFEAGAISKSTGEARVVPLLLDLRKADVVGPLAQFQAVDATDQDDVFQLVKAINDGFPEPLPEHRLRRYFEHEWPNLSVKVADFRKTEPAEPERRDERDVLDEILVAVRELQRESHAADRYSSTQSVHIESGPVHLYLDRQQGADIKMPDAESEGK